MDFGTVVTIGCYSVVGLFVLWFISSFVKILDQYERAIIFRLGRFTGVRGPGLVVITPIISRIFKRIDTRVIQKKIKIEVLTKDQVSIKVQAVLFYFVTDVELAGLKVEDYKQAIKLAAQTSLRTAIGASDLSTVLANRDTLDKQVRVSIQQQSAAWGIEVQAIDINDIILPKELDNSFSQSAQAKIEVSARTMLAESETIIAQKFVEAAKVYEKDPVAIQLRTLNLTYEAIKSAPSNTVLFPASALDGLLTIKK